MTNAQVTVSTKPFIEHVRELRRALFICVISILAGSTVGYALTDQLLSLLQQPLGQKLYYTSPTGAFSFVIKLAFTFGIIVSLPIIIHQIVRFLSPVMESVTRRHIIAITTWSFLLAVGGVAFTYYISLPGALHFLTNFHAGSIESLITADAYFTFVIAYLFGAALLFQLPLLMLVINKVRPLKPSKLLSIERYVLVGSVILAAIITPTPDPINLAIMTIPIVIMYQVGVVLVWLVNRKRTQETTSSRSKRIDNVQKADRYTVNRSHPKESPAIHPPQLAPANPPRAKTQQTGTHERPQKQTRSQNAPIDDVRPRPRPRVIRDIG